MEKRLTINSSFISKLIFFETIYIFCFNFLIQVCSFPRAISYFIDAANIVLLVYLLNSKRHRRIIRERGCRGLYRCVLGFVLVCFLSAAMHLVKPQLVLWAARNNFRFFVYFFALVCFLKGKEREKLESFMSWFYTANLLVTLFQYFVLGLNQDNLGGLFGNSHTNAFTLAYLCVFVTYTVQKYLRKEVTVWVMLYVFLTSVLIAALAELKAYFLFIAVITTLSLLLNRFNWKILALGLFLAVGLRYGIGLMLELFPQWASRFTDLRSFLDIGNDVGGGYNLSRFGGFATINEMIFQNNVFSGLFGLGFGNCEYSSISFFTSVFFRQYGDLNYRWFQHLTMYLECGYLGVAANLCVFLASIICLIKQKRKENANTTYINFGIILSAISLLMFFYNASLREECGYILYFGIGLAYVRQAQCSVPGLPSKTGNKGNVELAESL